jgi:predicted DNA-binding protein (UPF0251 family)
MPADDPDELRYKAKALDRQIHWFRSMGYPVDSLVAKRDATQSKLNSLQSPPSTITIAQPEDVGEESKPPTTRKRMKEPAANAFAAYRAVKLAGLKQEDVGHRLGVGQSTISRWIDKVVEWLEGGNVLPDELAAQPPRPKPINMEPRKLEQGPRRRGRA